MELNVSSASQGGHAVVTVSGELDLYTAPRLQAVLARLLRERTDRVVVDLSGMEFCNSTGINVLLAAKNRLKEQGGRLELAAPRPTIRRILQMTGLDTVFCVHDDVPALDVT